MTEMTAAPAAVDEAAAAWQELGAQQRREEARRMYRESVEAELPMTAESLGRTFSRSIRWGRDRIAEVRTSRRPGGMPQQDPATVTAEIGNQRAAAAAAAEAVPVGGMPHRGRDEPQAAAGMPAGRRGSIETRGMRGHRMALTSRQRFVVTALGIIAGLVAGVGTLAVAAAGFTLSFDAIRGVGQAAFIRPSLTWMLPVCVDGAMSVATVCAVVLRRMGRRPVYPWLVVLAGAGISIAANALHAYQQAGEVPLPAQWAMAVSAVPPLLLAMSVHLLVILAVALRETGRP